MDPSVFPQSINAEFISTKREKYLIFNIVCGKGTTCLLSQRLRPGLQSDISSFTVLPRVPTLKCNWTPECNRLVYTILAKSYCSRWQNLPKLRDSDSHCTSVFYICSPVESSFFAWFFRFDRKYLRDNERHYLARKVRSFEETKITKNPHFKLKSFSAIHLCRLLDHWHLARIFPLGFC